MIMDTDIGPMDAGLLERKDMHSDNDNESTHRVEYYFMGRLVRSDVHVHLKKGLPSLMGQTAKIF